jgi:hypothetical protein
MSIETLDDIVEKILDQLGIYGACGEQCTDAAPCRCCASVALKSRIAAAVEIEKTLSARQEIKVAEQTPTNNESDAILALRDCVKMVELFSNCPDGSALSPIQRGQYNRAKDVLKRAHVS